VFYLSFGRENCGKDGMIILSVIPARAKSFRRKRYLRGMRESHPSVIPAQAGIQKEYLQTNKDNIKRIGIL
jgi:hypothetical protein